MGMTCGLECQFGKYTISKHTPLAIGSERELELTNAKNKLRVTMGAKEKQIREGFIFREH